MKTKKVEKKLAEEIERYKRMISTLDADYYPLVGSDGRLAYMAMRLDYLLDRTGDYDKLHEKIKAMKAILEKKIQDLEREKKEEKSED